MKRQAFFRSFLLLLLVFAIILIYQAVWKYIPGNDGTIRNFAFFSSWLTTDTVTKKIVEDTATAFVEPIPDTVIQPAENDSLTVIALVDTLPPGTGLEHFFRALTELKQGKRDRLRIAWFGDSMIEGDLIVMTFRNDMQRTYGGEGVGFVPITSPVAGFRITVKHEFSENWKSWNVIRHKNSPFPFGLTCSAFTADTSAGNGMAWVKYSGGNAFRRTFAFPQGTLFYGKRPVPADTIPSDSLNTNPIVRILTKDSLIGEIHLEMPEIINTAELFTSTLKEITLQFECDTAMPFYGVDLGGKTGVNVDNYAFRGNSGYGLMSVNNEMLQAFQGIMQYDLIVLQYGTNVMSPGKTDYGWYGNAMNYVYRKLKRNFGNCSFLAISIADRAIKENTEMVTDPGVHVLVEIQKKTAIDNGLAFFDLFEAMGGEGSIKEWVEQEEPWANPDYTHLNFKGAREVAGLIYNFIHDEYEEYMTSPVKTDTAGVSMNGGMTE